MPLSTQLLWPIFRPLLVCSLLSVSTTLHALTPSLCEDGTLKQLADTSVLKCESMGTSEENLFLIKHATGYHRIEASRFLPKGYDKRLNYPVCGTLANTKNDTTDGYVFALKGPAKDGSCFDLFQATIPVNRPLSLQAIGTSVFASPKVDQLALSDFSLGTVTRKAYLHNSYHPANQTLSTDFSKHLHRVHHDTFTPRKTKMYLIKGDQVTLLQQQQDATDQTWYLVNYRGKKDLTMWLPATAVKVKVTARLDVTKRQLIVGDRAFFTPFIAKPLNTQLRDTQLSDTPLNNTKSEFILQNEYRAAATSKSAETLIIDKETLTVNHTARITYKPRHGVYVGWVLNTRSASLPTSEKALNALQLSLADFNYHIEDRDLCKRVTYSIQKDDRYFKYCFKQHGVFTLDNNSVHLAQYTLTADKKIVFEKMVGCHYSYLHEGNSNWLSKCFDTQDNYLSSHRAMPDKPSIKRTLDAARRYEQGDCRSMVTYRMENCSYHRLANAYRKLKPLLTGEAFKTWLLGAEIYCWDYYQDVYPGREATLDRLGCLLHQTNNKIVSLE